MINKKGLNIIISSEVFYSKPYLCPKGKPTIGYGTTIYPNGVKVTLKDKEISKETAYNYLMFWANKNEKEILKLLKVALNENQLSALGSWCYNFSPYRLSKSTLLKLINKNPNDVRIKNEFMKWVYVTKNGIKIIQNGLVIRRMKESKLYFSQ